MRATFLLLVAFLLGISGVAGAQPAARRPAAEQKLLPGDIVRLRIWREPDLSGEFAVDVGGMVTFPKLGPINVLGESSESLTSKLIESYEQYLRNASIEVTLLRRINILGAVRNPGLYPVDATMSIADAVALAGGATSEGNRRKIQLVRNGERIAVGLEDRTLLADLQLLSGDQIFVPDKSWISRNPAIVAATITSLATVLAILLR